MSEDSLTLPFGNAARTLGCAAKAVLPSLHVRLESPNALWRLPSIVPESLEKSSLKDGEPVIPLFSLKFGCKGTSRIVNKVSPSKTLSAKRTLRERERLMSVRVASPKEIGIPGVAEKSTL